MASQDLIDFDEYISKQGFFDFLSDIDVDTVLDQRDDAPFDDLWMEAFHRVDTAGISDENSKFIDSLREKSFKNSLRASEDSEIAGRVCDDIELIAKTLLSGEKGAWPVAYLWDSYKNGIFPS